MIYNRPLDRLFDWLTPARRRRGRPFWALRDLTFDVPIGSSTGVSRVNGAGKSTLLKILTGTTMATQGSFSIGDGSQACWELGTGFSPRIHRPPEHFFGGKMAGLSGEELAERFDSIVEFSELGQFIEQPVRTYSSGMLLRLGFALASSVDPDVLIIDEALSVGDLHFQQKCLRRIAGFTSVGRRCCSSATTLRSSRRSAPEAILLDEGRLIDRGAPDQVLDYYTALLAEKYREGGRRATIVRPAQRPAGQGETPSGNSAARARNRPRERLKKTWSLSPFWSMSGTAPATSRSC